MLERWISFTESMVSAWFYTTLPRTIWMGTWHAAIATVLCDRYWRHQHVHHHAFVPSGSCPTVSLRSLTFLQTFAVIASTG